MSDSKLNELLNRLGELMDRQNGISQELIELRGEIKALKSASEGEEQEVAAPPKSAEPHEKPKKTLTDFASDTRPPEEVSISPPKPKRPSILVQNWEKFIGENLISKIGIAIIVLGVGIGAKYAIDNELINPLTRIILGYLAGVALLVFAIRLKAKYDKFSAVLLSGAIAILYFITFAAYDFYELIPQVLAFVLMVVFTLFAVLAALKYDMSVIAHIGLVGAYAVPFLLSNDSGNEVVLFSYMSIVNLGILFISFKKDWKRLYYSAFVLSWLIFLGWSGFSSKSEDLASGLVFATLFFLIFYAMLLAFKVIKGQKFKWDDIILLVANSFIYFSLGYYFLDNDELGGRLLGVFALANAVIHFVVGLLLYKRQLADKNLFYFVVGLVIVFITIAVPIQLDGSWVTLLWVGEAALLFWIGRTKDVAIYEKMSYALVVIGFVSLLQDWEEHTILSYYQGREYDMPFGNVAFYSSLLVALIYGFINYLNLRFSTNHVFQEGHLLQKLIKFALPGIFLVVLFNTFRLEIANFWNLRYIESAVSVPDGYTQHNYALLRFGNIWNFCYSMLFFGVLLILNVKRLKEPLLAGTGLILSTLVILGFLTNGLLELHSLRDSYLNQSDSEYFTHGGFYIGFRYVAFLFFAILMIACYWQVRQKLLKVNLDKAFNIVLMISGLFILSSELLNLMDLAGQANSFRLSLSILWGIYSLVIIVLGIWKRKKYLRISAIVIFGITLLKVFFYDIADLDTISKTIVFVSLGILLLITSFLYNKYKHLISDVDEKD